MAAKGSLNAACRENSRFWDKVTGVTWALCFSSELSRSLFSPQITPLLPVGGLLFLSAVAHGHPLSMRLPMPPHGVVHSAILQLSRKLLPPFSSPHTSPSACPRMRRLPETLLAFCYLKLSSSALPTQTIPGLFATSLRLTQSPFWTYPAPLSLSAHTQGTHQVTVSQNRFLPVFPTYNDTSKLGLCHICSIYNPQWVLLQYSAHENHDNSH